MAQKIITHNNLTSILKSIILCFSLISSSHASNINFPKNINFTHNNKQLEMFLTGKTIRQKFFLDIYSMAHYVEKKPTILDNNIYSDILLSSGAKQISMIFLRDLSSDQIQKSLIEGIKLNSTQDQYVKIQPHIKKFMQAIHKDVEQDDRFIIRWLPDGTLISIFQGKQVCTIKNALFAKTLWSIWLSDQSIVNREALISQLITNSQAALESTPL